MGIGGIEKLPVELLQPIFIASGCNLSLLQVSPYIASRLSSEYIYNAAANYYIKDQKSGTDRFAAQTYIFASKWMTWAFFQSWIVRTFKSSGCLCGADEYEPCFDAQWPPEFHDATRMVFSRSHLPRLAFVKGRLPKKLLRGPWTQDKIQFLRFLLWTTSMTVNWGDEASALTALSGRNDAMMEGNLEAIELFNHNRRLGKAADLSTIRFAVIDAGCNRSIVYDTMLAADSWGGIRGSCEELDKWCLDRIAQGDPKGQWVKSKLEELWINDCDDYQERRLDPQTGSYDGGENDQLIVHDLEWNKVISVPHLLPHRA